MSWKGFFEGIESFFVDFAFGPYDALRKLDPVNWTLSNVVSWIFLAVFFVLFFYWLGQLKKFAVTEPEDESLLSQTFL